MRSLISTSILIISCFSTFSSASRLKDLILHKYREHLLPAESLIQTFVDINGQVVTVQAQPLMTFERVAFSIPQNLQVLSNFEEDPDAVYNNEYMRRYAFQQVVKDYRTEEASQEIIDYYREFGIGKDLISGLVYFGFYYNVQEIIELFIDEIAAIVATGKEVKVSRRTWMDAVFECASFKILESLIARGIFIVPLNEMVYQACTRLYGVGIDACLEFIDYLLRLRLEFDLNAPLTADGRTALMNCLHVETAIGSYPNHFRNECQRRVANLLIKLGANPLLVDENGLNAHQVAAIHEITLTVPE